MAIPRTSNYEIMKNQMREKFLKYDQNKMIMKFSLPHDEQYIYIRFVGRQYRINRLTGKAAWSEDNFLTETEADYNEAMTIYDVLCCSKESCKPAGTFCPVNMLKGTVQTTGGSDSFFQKSADQFAGKTDLLQRALLKLGERTDLKGDAAARINVFDFLPVIVQYWDADEEFPAVLKFMVDENIQDFMHFETVMFMLGHVLHRITECMEEKENTPKLGFGLMRLPKLPGEPGKIDLEQTKQMVDLFMEAGMTYFDTAYVYDNGDSERAAREALVERYPRESFTLATKLNVSPTVCQDEASAKQEFFTSLERTGAGYFDYYLLHAIQDNNYQTFDKYHIWDFVKEQKEKGLIRHWGFSFHATPELLDKLLTEHPEADFVQLQLNYADWDNPNVQSRANWETARRHGKSIVVMEPVKGGTLAHPPQAVENILKAADPKASLPSWAIRYAASLDGILTVLSGMSNLEQMQDNLSYMRNFRPLDAREQDTVKKAQEALSKIDSIPCTGCHYCTPGCPMEIPIPEIFNAKNRQMVWEQTERGIQEYAQATRDAGKASDCVECGQCESACPQRIPIITRLKDCAATLEKQ